MKKKVLLLVVLLFIFIPRVSAKELTFESVVEDFKKFTIKDELGEIFDTFKDAKVSSTANSMKVTYTYKEEGEEDQDYITTFNYKDGVISYKFDGDKNAADTMLRGFIDNIWIMQLIYSVGTLQGYSVEDITKFFEKIEEESDFSKYGFEMTEFSYSYKEDNASVSGTTADTFKIDINKFNLGNTSNNENNTPDNIDEEIENPQTGTNTIILISIALIGAISSICLLKKKNVLKKI